ncbi:MAG: PD-(D/E)XK nuclease family protein [Myxococcota bacterium]
MSGQLSLWPGEEPGERIHWSVTRHRALESCERRYYYQYYGSRGGGQADAVPALRELYMLKQLRTRFMWVGEIVHEMIELMLTSLHRGVRVPVDALIERGTRRMRAQYAESVQRLYRLRPGQACGLIEHEYDEAIAPEDWSSRRDAMQQCLHTFAGLPLVQAILAAPAWRWLAVETLGSFELDGARIVAKPDLVWRSDDDAVEIIDWKTGASGPGVIDELQVAVYGLHALRAWGADPERLRARLVFLGSGLESPYALDAHALARADDSIKASVMRMRSLALDGPRGEDAFARTEDLGRCRHCPFRRPCGRA